MRKYNALMVLGAVIVFAVLTCSVSSADYPTRQLFLTGAVFDDGGQATGSFWWNVTTKRMPLPQFYNIQVSTSAGSTLNGSNFSSEQVCYDDTKRFVCAPEDDFLVVLETGIPGQAGYDRFQFAAFFAPQALVGKIGVLDPVMSYETACTATACTTRHIVAGAIRP